MNEEHLNGLILAGGKSSRMGLDKGLIAYHGKPQREFLFALLKEFCSEVFTSCKKIKEVPAHLNPLPDLFEIESPMNGILTAFHYDAAAAWLTAPVDMPYIDKEIIQFLIDHRDKDKLATCFYDSEGDQPEPLLAIWEPKATFEMKRSYLEGNVSPRKFLVDHNVKLLSSPTKKLHININSKEDLEKFFGDHFT